MPFGRTGLKNFAAMTCYTVYVINLATDQDWSLFAFKGENIIWVISQ